MLSQLLLETVLGGLTGYFTNDIAIKGLFKKGGVVEKTRAEFTHEASKLLEEKVLTAEVLTERLQLPLVEEALADLLRHFFLTHLPAVLANETFGHLASYEAITESLTAHLISVWTREQAHLSDLLLTHLDVASLLTASQRAIFEQALREMVVTELQQGHYGAQFVAQFLTAAGTQNLGELGLTPMVDKISRRLQSFTGQWLQTLHADYDEALTNLLLTTMAHLDIPGLLTSWADDMGQQPLSTYVTADAAELSNLLKMAVQSSEGEQLLTQVIDRLVDHLAQLDVPLSAFVSDSVTSLLTPFLQEQLPDIIAQIVLWLKKNQDTLNDLIEEAITETLGTQEGIKGAILQIIRSTVLQNIAAEHSFVEKMGVFLNANVTTEEAVTIVMAKVHYYLQTKSLGALIRKLDQQDGLLRTILLALVKDNLHLYLDTVAPDKLTQLLAKPVGDFLHLAPSMDTIMQAVAHYLVQHMDSNFVQKSLDGAIIKLQQRLLATPLHETRLNDPQCLNAWIIAGQEAVVRQVATADFPVDQWLSQLALRQLIPRVLADMTQPLADGLTQFWRTKGDASPRVLYEALVTTERVTEMLPEAQRFLQAKVVQVVSSQLGRLAENSLNKLSNDALLELVQDFMGRELKPLNYLGAALGATVGLTTGAVLVTGSLGGMLPSSMLGMAALLGGKSVVYGAVGYGTNCAAIKGLFWPYHPVAGINAIQGVIPKQQKTFAESLGKMVTRYVLNEDIFQGLLQTRKSTWKDQAVTWGENALSHQALLPAAPKSRLQSAGYQILRHLSATHGGKFLDTGGNIPTAKVLPQTISAEQLQQLPQMLWPLIEQKAVAFGHDQRKIGDCLPFEMLLPALKTLLKSTGDRLIDLDLQKSIPTLEPSYQHWQEKALAQLLPPSLVRQKTADLQSALRHGLAGESVAQMIASGLNGFFNQQCIGEAFGGRINQWVEKNIHSLLQPLLNHVIGLINTQKPQLTVAIATQIKKNMSFLQQLGYGAMNGDALVEDVVTRLVDIKLPLFLGLKQTEIAQVLQQYWQEKIAPASLAQLQITLTPTQTGTLMQKLLTTLPLEDCLDDVTAQMVTAAVNLPLKEYLQYTPFTTLSAGVQVLPCALTQAWLRAHWALGADALVEQTLRVLTPFGRQQFAALSLSDLLGDIQLADWQALDWSTLWSMGQGDELSATLSQRLLIQAGQQPLRHWVDWPQLTDDLLAQSQHLLDSDACYGYWLTLTDRALTDFPQTCQRICPPESRQQLMGWIIEGFMDSLSADGSRVLREMNLAQVTSIQVQAMDAHELENLVRSFATPYFHHIQNWGWWGAAVAIPGIILSWLIA